MNEEAKQDDLGLVLERRDHIQIVRIDRQHRANAVTPRLWSALMHAFVDAQADRDIRVVILTGTGNQAFSSGGDLKDAKARREFGVKFHDVMSTPERFVLEVIAECTKPTIAAINGAAVAGGFELALACDLRIAVEHAMLGLPEAKRGLGAHFSTVMLPRVIPRAIALDLLFRGEYITAAEAHRCGFLNRVVPEGQALAVALQYAEQISRNAPVTVRRMKETAVKASGMPLASALRLNEGLNPYLSEDRHEGTRAFVEKRDPQWKGV